MLPFLDVISAGASSSSSSADSSGHQPAVNPLFGLRVKMVPYAEDICAVWLMLAVKFPFAAQPHQPHRPPHKHQ